MLIFITSSLVIVLPIVLGYAISLHLPRAGSLHDSNKLLEIPILFAIGLGGLGALSSFFYVIQASLIWFLITVAAIVCVLYFTKTKTKPPSQRTNPVSMAPWFALGLAVVLFAIQYPIGSYQDPSSDTFRHLAFITKILANGTFTDANFILSQHVPISALSTAYSFNAIHILYAVVSKLTHSSYPLVFIHAGAFLIPILFASVVALSSRLRANSLAGCFSVLLLLIWWSISPINTAVLSFPSAFGMTTYLALVGWIIATGITGRKPRVLTIVMQGALIATMVTIHLQWWFYCIFTICGLMLFAVFANQNKKILFSYFFSIFAITSICSAVLLLQKFQFQDESIAFGNLLRYRFENKLFKIGTLFAFNPFNSITPSSGFYICVAAVSMTVAVLNRTKRQCYKIVPSMMILLICLIMFNPLIVPVLVKSVSFTIVHRMNYLIELWGLILVGALLGEYFEPKILVSSKYRSSRWLFFAVGLISCLPFVLLHGSAVSYSSSQSLVKKYSTLYGPNITQIESEPKLKNLLRKIPRHSSVLSDNPDVVLAFSDAVIPGEIHNLAKRAKEIQALCRPIFELTENSESSLSALHELEIDYVFLTPSYSDLSWMQFNNSEHLELIEHLELPTLGFHNNRFVLYKVKQPTGEGVGPLEATAMDCEPVALFPKASTEIEPNQTDPNLLRLFDGKYTSIENALTWGLPRFNWFYLEFDFGETVFIDSLQIMLNNFDSRYRSNTFILYASHDGITYGQVGKPIVNDLPFVGERVLMFDGVGASSRYFRLAIKGEKFATIAEIEFMGCGGIN